MAVANRRTCRFLTYVSQTLVLRPLCEIKVDGVAEMRATVESIILGQGNILNAVSIVMNKDDRPTCRLM